MTQNCRYLRQAVSHITLPTGLEYDIHHCSQPSIENCTVADRGLKMNSGQPMAVCKTCPLYSPPAPRVGPAVTIGMATFDDYFGVWATCQSIHNARVEAGLVDQIEIVVVDNNPTGKHGEPTRGQLESYKPNAQYVEFNDHQGTSGPRNEIFRVAHGRGVVVIDPHVLFVRPVETLRKLVEFWSRPTASQDLFHGPCLHDCLIDHTQRPYIVGTHWRAEWGSDGMFGKWETAEKYTHSPHRINDPDEPPLEVPLNACGLFMAARDSWLGFHPEQRGFGGEEGTIHHKYREAGRTTFVLPWLQWVHRWGKPERVAYGGMEWRTRCRNYLLSTRDYGWPTVAELRANFVTVEPRNIQPNGDPNLATTGQQRVSEADWQALLTEMRLSDSASPEGVGSNVPHTVELKLLEVDPGLQPWEAEYLDNEATFGCVSREQRQGSVLCNIGCASARSQPVSLFWCKQFQSAVTLVERRTECRNCLTCPSRKPLDDDSIDPLVAHVARSIQRADRLQSNLPESTLAVQGMTSPRVRHLLNNICSAPGTRYLEVGCWLGALFISAQAGNDVEDSTAVDNFSEFNQHGGVKEAFVANCKTHLGHEPHLIDAPFESLAPADTGTGFNVYLYDASHTVEAQFDGIVRAWPALADRFILLVDDANLPGVLDATREALKQCGAKICRHWLLPAKFNGDTDRWWNGLAVAVIDKPQAKE